MAYIRIDSFGGESPSTSPRGLPSDAAQTNSNLYLATKEFRPLADDLQVATGMTAGAKTLYRIDSTLPWTNTAEERSYVRGQINGDVSKRTYFSTDSSTSTALRVTDSTGAERNLGVPAPSKPTLSVTNLPTMMLEDLAWRVMLATEYTMNGATDAARRYSGSTIYGGPLTNPGLLLSSHADVIAAGGGSAHWNLFAKVSATRALVTLGLDMASLGALYHASYYYIPLAAAPSTYREFTSLSTSLGAILSPRSPFPAQLDAGQISDIVDAYLGMIDVDSYASTSRSSLTDVVQSFYDLLYNYTPTAAGTPPTPPTKPTVGEYDSTYDSGTGQTTTTRNSLWVTYDASLATYNADLADYNASVTAAAAELASVNDRVKALQARALDLTRDIESRGDAVWTQIAQSPLWATDQLYALGGAAALPHVDAARVSEVRFYVVTFVTDWLEESAPSEVSDSVEVDQYGVVGITMPTVPSGYHITSWRIYRSNAGATSAAFQFVPPGSGDGISTSVTSYADSIESAALGEVLPTTTWAAPEVGLRGLVGMPNGVMAAFKGNTIHFCEPYVPYAWPVEYQITAKHPITGLGVFGQTLLVCTEGGPSYISGADSASMSETTLDSNQTCSSRRSIATVQGGVLFASPDGLCVADSSGVRVVSTGLYTREDWQDLNPSSMFAIEHERVYYLFYNNGTAGCLTFDLDSKKLGELTGATDVTAAYVDRVTDELFVVSGTALKKVHGAGTYRTGVWKSPLICLPAHSAMAWLKVLGSQSVTYPATVKWYVDGALAHTATVTDTNAQRLPAARGIDHEIQIESKSRLVHVMLAGSTQELQGI